MFQKVRSYRCEPFMGGMNGIQRCRCIFANVLYSEFGDSSDVLFIHKSLTEKFEFYCGQIVIFVSVLIGKISLFIRLQ